MFLSFAAAEHALRQAQGAAADGRNIYPDLFAEIPTEPSSVMVLPHFAPTGLPAFIADSCGVMAGLRLETTRGDILKGIIEGATFYLKACIETLPSAGVDNALQINDFRAVGGGSRSDEWVQVSADIWGRPFIRPKISEAGALGAAIIAGVGSGAFSLYEKASAVMVEMERIFEPNLQRQKQYEIQVEKYQELWPLLQSYLQNLSPVG